MSDEVTERLPVTDPHQILVSFCNQIVGCGALNGNVNITFAVARFSPNSSGGIDPDLVITSRLRMDLFCAQQLYDTLGKQLAAAMTTMGAPN